MLIWGVGFKTSEIFLQTNSKSTFFTYLSFNDKKKKYGRYGKPNSMIENISFKLESPTIKNNKDEIREGKLQIHHSREKIYK